MQADDNDDGSLPWCMLVRVRLAVSPCRSTFTSAGVTCLQNEVFVTKQTRKRQATRKGQAEGCEASAWEVFLGSGCHSFGIQSCSLRSRGDRRRAAKDQDIGKTDGLLMLVKVILQKRQRCDVCSKHLSSLLGWGQNPGGWVHVVLPLYKSISPSLREA